MQFRLHKSPHLRAYWTLQLLGWSASTGALLIFYWPYALETSRFRLFALEMPLAFLSTFLLRALGRRAWRDNQHLVARAALCVAISILFGFLIETIGELAARSFWDPSRHITLRSLLAESSDYAILLACWSASYLGIKSFLEAGNIEKLLHDERRRADLAQWDALRLQLPPRLVVNALHTAASLAVAEHRDQARSVVERLQELLNALLDSHEDGLTDLATELHHAHTYMELQQLQFGPALSFDFELQAAPARFQVPRWILLPLLEDALRYSITTAQDQATMRLTIRQRPQALALTLACRIVHQPHRTPGAIELDNIRSLLQAIYGDLASVSAKRQDSLLVLELQLPALSGPLAHSLRLQTSP